MGVSVLLDACPACFPGDHPAVAPRTVTPDVNGSLCAEYRHGPCGTLWATWWDAEAAGVSRLVPLQRTGSDPRPGTDHPSVWREALLRTKARLQAEESRRERGALNPDDWPKEPTQ